MKFSDFSTFLERLDATTSRNAMTEILAELFQKVESEQIREMVYLLDGRIVPLFVPVKFHIAEKMIVRAMAFSYGIDAREARSAAREAGDLGTACEELSKKYNVEDRGLSVDDVYKSLYALAEVDGAGSVEKKIELLSELIQSLSPLSVRYVMRIPMGKMRLGFSAMTVLDAYSWMIAGDKSLRRDIERAYNVRPDLGYIGEVLKMDGVEGLSRVKPALFTPILMARAERLSSAQEIMNKIGKCAVEPKIDGFRVQVHFDGETVRLFTRNLEDVTYMYPDVADNVKREAQVKNVIFEGEAIAYDPETDVYREFQFTSQRRRKYDIEEMMKKIPLRLIGFDLLYLDGKSYLQEPYTRRHETLARIVGKGADVVATDTMIAETADDIEGEFADAVAQNFEGIMAKRLDGAYQAGARGWNWIKYKASYSGALTDTIDVVVMGYYYGRGKRNIFGIGAFLIGVYDSLQDTFVTIAKVGTGLTDEEWYEMKRRCEALKSDKRPLLYEVDKNLEPDVWIEPSLVVEIRADEISRSPIHTAGRVMKSSKSGKAFMVDESGFALRFPRLERFRDDRKVDDITHLSEIRKMHNAQGYKK